MEEGECSSGEEEVGAIGQYTPLERPVQAKPAQHRTINTAVDSDSEDEPPEAYDSGSDSDAEGRPSAKKRNTAGPWGRRDALVAEAPGVNDTFKRMAAAFQAERQNSSVTAGKRRNNIWGTIIQEETLNTHLLGVGVGRSLKDLDSDRGAETYDYTLVAAEKAKERQRAERDRTAKGKGNLDNEMEEYWSKSAMDDEQKDEEGQDEEEEEKGKGDEAMDEEGEEQRRGTKRSVKDRLGSRRLRLDRYKEEKLAAPGEPKQLIDIGDEEAVEGTDEDFGQLLAERLGEDKPELIEGVVSRFGRRLALNIYRLVQQTEAKGGMVIHNGARRRTSGGIFLLLLKTESSLGVDQEAVKKFLADARRQDERKILAAKKKKKNKHFSQELEDFLKLRRGLKEQTEAAMASMDSDNVIDAEGRNEEEEEDEDGSPIPTLDVSPFANLVASMCKKKTGENGSEQQRQQEASSDSGGTTLHRLSSFKEPDAPPNSVERPLLDYDDDDFINAAGDTEGIELF